MTSFQLIEVFRFLAQSNEALAACIPKRDEDNTLFRRVDDDGFFDDYQIPSKAAALTCSIIINDKISSVNGVNDELFSIMSELQSLLEIMFYLPEGGAYFWMIDKNTHMVTGAFDTVWAILRRLASQALNVAQIEIGPPQTKFSEFIKFGGFARWRIVPASDE